jgi:gamma-aminobutyric acid type B receptor
MGLLTGLVPGGSTSCQFLNTSNNDNTTTKLKKSSIAQSGNAINLTHIEIVEPELIRNRNRRRSTAFTITGNTDNLISVEIENEPRVNFVVPTQRRCSIVHQNSQPTLRERVKGSPRFPHRIVPTSSLNALEDGFNGK